MRKREAWSFDRNGLRQCDRTQRHKQHGGRHGFHRPGLPALRKRQLPEMGRVPRGSSYFCEIQLRRIAGSLVIAAVSVSAGSIAEQVMVSRAWPGSGEDVWPSLV